MAVLFLQFLIYSFLGFLLEVLFARLTHSPKQDRKCLFLLPLCPVYGLGALLIAALPHSVQSRPLLLFLGGAAAATGAEYFTDWLCERALGVRFWNYSALPFHIHGRVCLLFSCFWGLLAIGLVRWVHPFVSRLTASVPAGWIIPLFLLFLADGVFTVRLLRATGDTAALRWYDRVHLPKKERS